MRRALAVLATPLLAAAAVASPATEPGPLRGLRTEAAALLVEGVEGGALLLAAGLFPAGGAAAAVELPFLVEVPAPAGTGADQPPLEAYVYAIDAAGEVVAHQAVELARAGAAAVGVKLSGRLRLAPGGYSIRFLVFDPLTRDYGLAVREVDLPAPLAGPRLAEECDGWAVAGELDDGLDRLSARPVLVAGERRRLLLPAAPPADGGAGRIRLTGAGARAATREVKALAVPGGLEFEVPQLPPGVYRLTVGDREESPALETWLVAALPPADGGCRHSWGRVLQQARAAAPAAALAAAAGGEQGQPERRLAAEYRAVLALLAGNGRLRIAGARLAELETSLVEPGLDRLRSLFASELVVARRLAERDPRCLIALIALHGESYRAHYAAGRFTLATHSRRLAAVLGELAAERLTAPAERSVLAGALAGLADRIETGRASLEAQRLLERALALDPDQETARLLLAVSYQRKGRYELARQQLETLAASNAAHHEARVRLAILELRLARLATARQRLLGVIAERPPTWLLSLAYQTLAQLLGRQERYEEAVTHLEEARERLPEEPAIQLLLAYALDRQGERRAAAEVLGRLPPATAGESARYRYSDEPAAARGLLHETLRQSVNVRLPLLARALAEESDQEAGP